MYTRVSRRLHTDSSRFHQYSKEYDAENDHIPEGPKIPRIILKSIDWEIESNQEILAP